MKTVPSNEVTPISSLVREAIYREHFLINALHRARAPKNSVSAKDYASLEADLRSNQEALHEISGRTLFPALSAIASGTARAWERDMEELFSDEKNRWERVLRLVTEMTALIKLVEQIRIQSPDREPMIDEHLKRLKAHATLHEKILFQWISAEKNHGHPVDSLVGTRANEIEEEWNAVLDELLPRTSGGNSPHSPLSWRSVERAVDSILSAFTPTREKRKAA